MTYYYVMRNKRPLAADVRIVPIDGKLPVQWRIDAIEVACAALNRGDYVAIAELVAYVEALRTGRR